MCWYLQAAAQPNAAMRRRAAARQQTLTKPPQALGRLEGLAIELAALQGCARPKIEQIEIAIFAGDHGIVAEGVSAFPQAVTVQMVHNFIHGGAAISVMAKQLGARLRVVNAGTLADTPFAAPVVDAPIARGTHNFAQRAAMTLPQAQAALQLGRRIVQDYAATDLVIGGEMGIGNSSSATALAAALTGLSVASLIGRGSGLDARGVQHKQHIIETALARAAPHLDAAQPLHALAQLGGFELAALVGYYIAAAQAGLAVLVDGFIASAAALVACRVNPSVRAWLVFSHLSAEPGHGALLQYLDAKPLLDLDLRLGEGSGAAVTVNLLQSACALHNGMATFSEAAVSNQQPPSEHHAKVD